MFDECDDLVLLIYDFFFASLGGKKTGTYGQTVIGRTGSQPSSPHCCGMDQPHQQQPAKCADYGTLLPHPNYCHQISLEDQGIDLTQVTLTTLCVLTALFVDRFRSFKNQSIALLVLYPKYFGSDAIRVSVRP